MTGRATRAGGGDPATGVEVLCGLAGAQRGECLLTIGLGAAGVARLAAQVAPAGRVIAVEADQGEGERVGQRVRAAGHAPLVQVHVDAGAVATGAGLPDNDGTGRDPQVNRRYDRIVAAAVTDAIPEHWWDALRAWGRITVPYRLDAAGLTRAVRLERADDTRMRSAAVEPWPYAPGPSALRRLSTATTRLLDGVELDHEPTVDRMRARRGRDDELAAALERGAPRWTQWLGPGPKIGSERAANLDLWVRDRVPRPFARLRVSEQARHDGIADPAPRWSGACVLVPGSCAWLVTRRDGQGREQVGVTAAGVDAPDIGGPLLATLGTVRGGGARGPQLTVHRAEDPGRHHGRVEVQW